MRTGLFLRSVWASGLVSSLTVSLLAGQEVGPIRATAVPPARTALASLAEPAPAIQVAAQRNTTFFERAAWGAGAGVLGVAAASAWLGDDDQAWVGIPLVGAASAVGVMLVTAKYEGARPVSTVLGTAIAMTLPGLLLATMDTGGEGPGPEILVGVALLVSAPLGAAAGHGLGAR